MRHLFKFFVATLQILYPRSPARPNHANLIEIIIENEIIYAKRNVVSTTLEVMGWGAAEPLSSLYVYIIKRLSKYVYHVYIICVIYYMMFTHLAWKKDMC